MSNFEKAAYWADRADVEAQKAIAAEQAGDHAQAARFTRRASRCYQYEYDALREFVEEVPASTRLN